MQEQTASKTQALTPVETNDFVAGKSLKFYWQAIKWFIVLLVVLNIFNIVFEVYEYGHWVVEVVVFIIFSFYLLKRWKVKVMTVVTASIFLGLASGLLLAIFDIIWYHQWWYLLNLVRQPFIVSLVGAVTSLVFCLLFNNLKFRNKSKDLKGGGIYGRKKANIGKFR